MRQSVCGTPGLHMKTIALVSKDRSYRWSTPVISELSMHLQDPLAVHFYLLWIPPPCCSSICGCPIIAVHRTNTAARSNLTYFQRTILQTPWSVIWYPTISDKADRSALEASRCTNWWCRKMVEPLAVIPSRICERLLYAALKISSRSIN